MNSNYYRGFIDVCLGCGMNKRAADTMYKQAIGVKPMFSLLRAAMKSGKPIESVAIQGRNIAKDPALMKKMLRFLDNPESAKFLRSKAYFGQQYSPEAVANFRKFLTGGTAPAEAVSGVPRQMMLPGFEATKAAPGKVPHRIQVPEAAPISPRPTVRRVNIGESLTAQQKAQRAAAFKARGQQPAAPAPAAAETPATPPAPPTPAAEVSPEVANNAVNEMAAGTAAAPQQSWLGGALAAHPYLGLGAAAVPAFGMGMMYANRDR